MFDLSVATIGSVSIVTSEKGGLSNDQIAEMLANKLIYISDEAPEPKSNIIMSPKNNRVGLYGLRGLNLGLFCYQKTTVFNSLN